MKFDFSSYRGRRVLVTGHTGFKGSWLCEWLLRLGASVHGYALKPPTKPALFTQLGLSRRLAGHVTGDVRDRKALAAYVRSVKPDFVFHLAAQPLVRLSYAEPAETFDANVMGTVNLLDAVRKSCQRRAGAPCAVVCVTTDKCYENDESGRAFVETDPMGGSDPYSASKGACEIAISSYRRSFFAGPGSTVRVASARAGNVIGGGDWAKDRIVPDVMRAFAAGKSPMIRNRASTRPWQHVLEPLCGYLELGAALYAAEGYDEAFNFGPDPASSKTVWQLVSALRRNCPDAPPATFAPTPGAPREAGLLSLDSSKAAARLGWTPRWDFAKTAKAAAEWYCAVAGGASPRLMTARQIEEYEEDCK